MADGRQLDEDIGQQLAEWARGRPPITPEEWSALTSSSARRGGCGDGRRGQSQVVGLDLEG